MASGKDRKPARPSRAAVAVKQVAPAKARAGSKRSCGECTACCVSLAVRELDKPAFTPCQHLRSPASGPGSPSRSDQVPGCASYQDRPTACRDFRCGWLDGFPMTGPADRPDRLGIILIPTIDPSVMQVREAWPDASREPRAQEFITELRRAGLRVELVSPSAQKTLQALTLFGRPLTQVRASSPGRAAR